MTLNGVGSRTRLGLPVGGPHCAPLSRAHQLHQPRPETPRAATVLWVAAGCTRATSLAATCASLSMTPGAPLLRLLAAVSAAAAVAGAPGTALPPTTGDATLAFVFDVTGSMWDDLMQVIDGASRILERSLSSRSQAIANYVLVPFHDPGSEGSHPPRAPRPAPSRCARSPDARHLCALGAPVGPRARGDR